MDRRWQWQKDRWVLKCGGPGPECSLGYVRPAGASFAWARYAEPGSDRVAAEGTEVDLERAWARVEQGHE